MVFQPNNMVIVVILLCLVISYLSWKVYQLQNAIDELKEDWVKFQRSETVKREVGWDSVWKMVNRNS